MIIEGPVYMGGREDWEFFDVKDDDYAEEKFLTDHLQEYYRQGQRVRVTVELLESEPPRLPRKIKNQLKELYQKCQTGGVEWPECGVPIFSPEVKEMEESILLWFRNSRCDPSHVDCIKSQITCLMTDKYYHSPDPFIEAIEEEYRESMQTRS